MTTTVFSKTTAPREQSLYLKANGKEYYLFSQNYRRAVKEYYSTPVALDRALDFSCSNGLPVRKTMEKLRAYIPYIEREYGVSVLKKTKKAQRPNKTVRIRCDDEDCEVA
jgi:hypothetical protein